MNATITLVGALLTFAGVLATATVAFVGKRGELALTGFGNLTDQLQEELAAKKKELAEQKVESAAALAAKDAALAAESAMRAAAEAENARLRGIVRDLGGTP
jgi:hypothetical protein